MPSGAGAGEDAGVAAPLAHGPKPGVIVKKTPVAIPKESPVATEETHRHPEKSAKNHENMAKRAKNVLLAISSGGGIFIFL